MRTKYNENITLVERAAEESTLKKNEYFALMVTDEDVKLTGKREQGDTRSFFNLAMGWLGLECTSERRVYISKKFGERNNSLRGITFKVKVKKPKLCSILKGRGD